jgi:hypothetical protein
VAALVDFVEVDEVWVGGVDGSSPSEGLKILQSTASVA